MKIKEKIFLMLIPLLFGGMKAMAVDKVDGFYKIGTAEDLLEFTDIVNNGEVDASAQLTADITVDFPNNTFIGMNGKDYQGTFDGQGHTLTVTINRSADGGGLFANIGANGKVCNLIIDGTISGITGVGSFAWQNFGTLENCISVATVKTSAYGFGACAGFTCASVGNAVYKNCIFAGSIEGENANEIAGFNWVTNGGQPIYENCVCVPTSVNVAGYFAWSQQDGNGVYRNCYFTDVAGTDRCGRATLIEKSLLESGELCFKLNGDQSNIIWTQTLGEDSIPYPFTSHKQVYSTASLNCAGQPIGVASYSNTPSSTDLPPHTYDNGFTCGVCGHIDENYCEQINGFYQIGTAEQMDWFAAFVNSGKTSANAQLTADIDWSASSIVMGTGGNFDLQFMDNRTSEHDYQGTFDGQGHTLTVNIDHQSGGTGLFAHIGENGKVCNIIIDGTISGTTGVGTFAWENWGTLENCVSLATIRTSAAGFAACGGMTCASHGSAVYKNCIFAGSIEGENANEIAGFNWYAGNAQPIYENCVCAPTSVNVSGYFAWSQQDGNGVYRNCYFTDVAGTDRCGSAVLIENSLLASGELCYKLNGDQSSIIWTQTLGEDEIPYPFTTHKTVVPNEDGSFGNITGIENLTTDNRHQTIVIYDLSGRRISASSKLSKGIYVINGKKTVIK